MRRSAGASAMPEARSKPVHVAVVGTGSAGMRHLAALGGTEAAKPVAIPRHPERIGRLRDAGHSTATDLDDAVGQGATMCVIATGTGMHAEDGLAAIERGLDVLVEKPLAVSAAEAAPMIERARTTGRKVFVANVLRFSESLNAFRDLLPRVGRVHSVHLESHSYLPDWRPDRPYRDSYSARPREGGVLLDQIHEVDTAGRLYGWPVAMRATLRNLGRLGIEAEEVAELSWITATGYLVSISLDYLTRPATRRMRARGERGTIEWDGIAGTVGLSVAGEPGETLRASETIDEMFLAQARAFVNAGAGTVDTRLSTGDDGIKALAACDAARRSSESGGEAEVRYL